MDEISSILQGYSKSLQLDIVRKDLTVKFNALNSLNSPLYGSNIPSKVSVKGKV